MAAPFIPVETILKVDDNELIETNPKTSEPACTSTNSVSIGTQVDWKVETVEDKMCGLLPVTENNETKYELINSAIAFGERNEDLPLVIRGWPPQCDTNVTPEQKFIIPGISQQFTCNIQTLPFDEKFFLQFDYKTRNKLKTKQRRLDPYYRTQERVRQRTVMRLKRQDPRFRAAEREKGRYRMRLKRLDPVFRSQERERQRERMKIKRSNPDFREKEREQQKNRLHIKRLDPAFKEKERAQDLLRAQLKKQNEALCASAMCDDKMKFDPKIENAPIISDQSEYKEVDEASAIPELRTNQVLFHDALSAKLLSIRSHEPSLENFHFKKQHILNFNFYNSSKEQWPVPSEITVKNLSQFTGASDNVKLETNDVTAGNNVLVKSKYFQPRKTFLKQDIMDHPMIDIKSESAALPEIDKIKDSIIPDSPTVLSCASTSVILSFTHPAFLLSES